MLLNKIIYLLPSRFSSVIYPLIKWYYRLPRTIQFRGIALRLHPTVFHPKLYLTTETFLDYLLTRDLKGQSTLELGCGSGAISLYLALNCEVDAHVSDINPAAIDGVISNAARLHLPINTYLSDLFANIPNRHFDVLVINPPFFAHPADSIDEYAFNAGQDYQYFKSLARQLKERQDYIGITYMILTDKCDLRSILGHFTSVDLKIENVFKVQSLGEEHLIYSVGAV